MYDVLIVGAGLYGATCAEQLSKRKSVLVIDIKDHIAGNCYTEKIEGIDIHVFGAHCFHCTDTNIWQYVNQFTKFKPFHLHGKATYKGKMYSLPFNMWTFNQLWGCKTPDEAKQIIDSQRIKIDNPSNLEEWVLSQLGTDIYQTLIYGYSKKQWCREPKELPAFIIKRLPVRYTYDDAYFDNPYQGVPENGYSAMVDKMLEGIEVRKEVDFKDLGNWRNIAKHLIYTGSIDDYHNHQLGTLEYRSLRFERKIFDCENYQGAAVINYTDYDVPWTRLTEHKHFSNAKSNKTVVTFEYPETWDIGKTRYYPINDEKNNSLYDKYKELSKAEGDVTFGGRLGKFRYWDMHQVIGNALVTSRTIA